MAAYMRLAKALTAKGDKKKAQVYLDKISRLMQNPKKALLEHNKHMKRRRKA